MSEIFAVELRTPNGMVLMRFMLPADSALMYDPPPGGVPSGLLELWVGKQGVPFQCLDKPFTFSDGPLMVSAAGIATFFERHSGLVGIRMEARA